MSSSSSLQVTDSISSSVSSSSSSQISNVSSSNVGSQQGRTFKVLKLEEARQTLKAVGDYVLFKLDENLPLYLLLVQGDGVITSREFKPLADGNYSFISLGDKSMKFEDPIDDIIEHIDNYSKHIKEAKQEIVLMQRPSAYELLLHSSPGDYILRKDHPKGDPICSMFERFDENGVKVIVHHTIQKIGARNLPDDEATFQFNTIRISALGAWERAVFEGNWEQVITELERLKKDLAKYASSAGQPEPKESKFSEKKAKKVKSNN